MVGSIKEAFKGNDVVTDGVVFEAEDWKVINTNGFVSALIYLHGGEWFNENRKIDDGMRKLPSGARLLFRDGRLDKVVDPPERKPATHSGPFWKGAPL